MSTHGRRLPQSPSSSDAPASAPESGSSSSSAATSILKSPFLNHSIIDRLLAKPVSTEERIRLLSAKIHLYAKAPDTRSSSSCAEQSNTANRDQRRAESDRARMPEMQTRLNLARTLLSGDNTDITQGPRDSTRSVVAAAVAEASARHVQAQAEVEVVLRWTKGVVQGIKRRRRQRREEGDGEGHGDGAHSCESGGDLSGQDGDERGAQSDGPDWITPEHLPPLGQQMAIPPNVPLDSGTSSKGEGDLDANITQLRREAVGLMIRIEEQLGRTGRAERLRQELNGEVVLALETR